MSLEAIKKRWDYKHLMTYQGMNEGTAAQLDEDIRKLINFAEATLTYFHAMPCDDHEAWKRFQEARKELEGK